ncbi:hypothetical protein HHL22_19915 [Hymenobacter sp. RP-2-7]|uniref:STAS/SEC14 domain-containing protein n=1 Tax=Hymenobacter polaris TaxID=2682546 RepID=A0A7Y0AI24_9BACT|nr:hypothetical protein [Hymenobacter polaris]NML67475.1 hypothetical protein [Hymenobacter polaris]
MLLPVPLPAEVFTLEYRPDQALLVARWLQPLALPELQASYEALLAAALTHANCRHWLLDVRRRPVGNLEALAWFRQQFSPRLVPALGGPLFVAYFAMVNQEALGTNSALLGSIAQGETEGAHYQYFNRENEALAWLAQQP